MRANKNVKKPPEKFAKNPRKVNRRGAASGSDLQFKKYKKKRKVSSVWKKEEAAASNKKINCELSSHFSAKAVKQSSTEKKKVEPKLEVLVGWLVHWIDRDRREERRTLVGIIFFLCCCSVHLTNNHQKHDDRQTQKQSRAKQRRAGIEVTSIKEETETEELEGGVENVRWR